MLSFVCPSICAHAASAEEKFTPPHNAALFDNTITRIHQLIESESAAIPSSSVPLATTGGTPADATNVLRVLASDDNPEINSLTLQLAPTIQNSSARMATSLAAPDPQRQDDAIATAASVAPSELAVALIDAMIAGGPDATENIGARAFELPHGLIAELETLLSSAQLATHRAGAAYLLGRMGARGSREHLSRSVFQDEQLVAEAAATALQRMNDIELIPVWTKLLHSAPPGISLLALDALAELRTPQSMEAVAAAAMGNTQVEHQLQLRAIDKLATWPPADAIPTLIRAMRNSYDLRNRAWRHLTRITGEDLPDVPSQWEQWYENLVNPQPPPLLPAAAAPESQLLNEVDFVPPPLKASVQ